jgi:hypothetical protein
MNKMIIPWVGVPIHLEFKFSTCTHNKLEISENLSKKFRSLLSPRKLKRACQNQRLLFATTFKNIKTQIS